MDKHNQLSRACYASFSLCVLLVFMTACSVGCGGSASPNCALAKSLDVFPATATADHTAAAPGNAAQFGATDHTPDGCLPLPGPTVLRTDLKWTVSDSANVTVGNTLNVDYGRATCVNATSGPVTVTASGLNIQNATITGAATLTCK